MLKVFALAALALSGSAFLFENHAMIWLVLALLPGAVAVLLSSPAHRHEVRVEDEMSAGDRPATPPGAGRTSTIAR